MNDRDLFGREVIYPMKAEQLPLFHEPNPAPPVTIPGETAEDRRIARKFAETPTAEMFPAKPVQRKAAQRPPSLPDRIEAELKRRGIQYVNVIEVKRALFQPRTIQSYFHFVVYAPAGDNWLLLVGEAGDSNRQAMNEWEQIFGDGFKAVFAVERAAGIIYKTLAGEKLDLSELTNNKARADEAGAGSDVP
jgi:hypothetical protein